MLDVYGFLEFFSFKPLTDDWETVMVAENKGPVASRLGNESIAKVSMRSYSNFENFELQSTQYSAVPSLAIAMIHRQHILISLAAVSASGFHHAECPVESVNATSTKNLSEMTDILNTSCLVGSTVRL